MNTIKGFHIHKERSMDLLPSTKARMQGSRPAPQGIKSILTKTIIIGSCSLATIFMYLHVFEKITFTDLPYISSVLTTSLPLTISSITPNQDLNTSLKYGFFGKPSTLRLPKANLAFNIQEPNIANSNWVITRDSINIYTFAESKGGYLGNSVLFTSDNSKSLLALQTLTQNDRIVLETVDNYKYSYKIQKKFYLSPDQNYLPPNLPSSLIYLLSKTGDKIVLVEASFLSIEEI